MRANGGRAGYEITALILVALVILLFHWNRQVSIMLGGSQSAGEVR